jgi:hypothetical protein
LLATYFKEFWFLVKKSWYSSWYLVLAVILFQLYGCSPPRREKLEAIAETAEGRLAVQKLPDNTAALTGQQLAQVCCRKLIGRK